MSFGTTSIDPGSTPSVAVARDSIASAIYQRVKLADATEDATTAIGVDANPLRTRDRRRGTSDYDSGIVAATITLTSVTAAAIFPEGGWVTNYTDTARWVTITNGADVEIVSRLVIAPRNSVPLPFSPGMGITGLKVQAEADSAIRVQVWGGQ